MIQITKMILPYMFFILTMLIISTTSNHKTCPTNDVLKKLDADYILAGFFPLHMFDYNTNEYILDESVIGCCGYVIRDRGNQ